MDEIDQMYFASIEEAYRELEAQLEQARRAAAAWKRAAKRLRRRERERIAGFHKEAAENPVWVIGVE